MRAYLSAAMLSIAISVTGCGSNDETEPEPEQEPMKVEDTVFGDLVGTQDKARDRANEAVDVHRDALERRLNQDEGASAPEE